MILSTLYLEIGDDVDVPTDYRYGFLKRSRVLCNYIEREVLREIKFKCEGFNRIVVSMCEHPSKGVFINSCQVACVEEPFNKKDYDAKKRRSDNRVLCVQFEERPQEMRSVTNHTLG